MELDVLNTIFSDGIMSGIGFLPLAIGLLAIAFVAVLILVVKIEPLFAIPVGLLPFAIMSFYAIIDIPYIFGGLTLLFGFMLAFALYLLFLKK